jgi:glycosyltransferase involved in cell wall biosynthesis
MVSAAKPPPDLVDSNVQRALPLRRAAASSRPRVGFVMEENVGHTSWYQNLRDAVDALDVADADWVRTTLFNTGGHIERLPGLPKFVRSGLRAYIDVRTGLRHRQHDVLFFNTQRTAMFSQWAMLHTPTILMTDVTPLQYDRMGHLYGHVPDKPSALSAIKHAVNVLNFQLARAVVGWSSWTCASLVSEYGVPADRVHVIPPGVDTQQWRPPAVRPDKDRVQLLFVGGDFVRKGGQILLDVFRDCAMQDRADLHIVTRDDVTPAPGVTIHRGLTNNSVELLDLYRRADVFVLPTLADCFSIASIEAMAMGLPVVTTDMGGISDIVVHGQTGYLTIPGDRRDLALALGRLLANASLRQAMGETSRARAVARFDARVSAGRLMDLGRALSATTHNF